LANKKTPRSITIEKPLVVAFQKGWPGFSEEEPETQISLIHAMRRAYHKRRQHKENEDAFYMTWQELEKEYGRGGFNEVNERLNLFHILKRGSSFTGVTNQYLVDNKADQIYAKVRKKKTRGQLTKILDGLGRVIRTLPGVLASTYETKSRKKVTAKFWKQEQLPQLVPINVNALDKLIDKLNDLEDHADLFIQTTKEKREQRLRYAREIRSAAHWEITGRGNVAHHYKESTTGRITAEGYNLQGAPRTIRKAALVGLWDYDIENCHYAIVQQMAKLQGMDCPHIEHYLHHKDFVRIKLANDIGVNEKQIKRALVAIIYGAHASTSQKVALFDAVGGKENARLLINTQLFKDLHKEVKQARNLILKNHKTSRGSLINVCDKGIKIEEGKNKCMAHLVQGVEAFMLRTALRLYPDDIVLLIHDGFVSTRQLDKGWIEREVKEVTGYDMKLSEKKISMPSDYDMDAD